MRLRADQLENALQKELANIYFISGDEPLQLGETADAVRRVARKAGYGNREILSVEKGFTWHQLGQAADSLSIFSERKLIDLRIPEGKPGTEGGKALTAYCENPPEDTVLLITSGKVAKSAQKARWFQSLDKEGVVIQVWPMEGRDLLQWLQRRFQSLSMQVDQEGISILAARIEGNLLAGAQEVDKLYVLYGAGRLGSQEIRDAVADSSRYDVFKLVDSVLSGKIDRTIKVLQGLKGEGIAEPVILWALAREARILLTIKALLGQGENRESVFKKNQIWDKRKPLVNGALNRLTRKDLEQVLLLSAKADRQIKGRQAGDPWETLLFICQVFASCQGLPSKV